MLVVLDNLNSLYAKKALIDHQGHPMVCTGGWRWSITIAVLRSSIDSKRHDGVEKGILMVKAVGL